MLAFPNRLTREEEFVIGFLGFTHKNVEIARRLIAIKMKYEAGGFR